MGQTPLQAYMLCCTCANLAFALNFAPITNVKTMTLFTNDSVAQIGAERLQNEHHRIYNYFNNR